MLLMLCFVCIEKEGNNNDTQTWSLQTPRPSSSLFPDPTADDKGLTLLGAPTPGQQLVTISHSLLMTHDPVGCI